MELTEYQSLIEARYGTVTLPKNDDDIETVLDSIDEVFTVVSKQDYHLLQAMMIVEDWRINNVDTRGEVRSINYISKY